MRAGFSRSHSSTAPAGGPHDRRSVACRTLEGPEEHSVARASGNTQCQDRMAWAAAGKAPVHRKGPEAHTKPAGWAARTPRLPLQELGTDPHLTEVLLSSALAAMESGRGLLALQLPGRHAEAHGAVLRELPAASVRTTTPPPFVRTQLVLYKALARGWDLTFRTVVLSTFDTFKALTETEWSHSLQTESPGAICCTQQHGDARFREIKGKK